MNGTGIVLALDLHLNQHFTQFKPATSLSALKHCALCLEKLDVQLGYTSMQDCRVCVGLCTVPVVRGIITQHVRAHLQQDQRLVTKPIWAPVQDYSAAIYYHPSRGVARSDLADRLSSHGSSMLCDSSWIATGDAERGFVATADHQCSFE